MGNTHVRPLPLPRNKKQVHWKQADRPSPPGKPQLISENDVSTPDLITIRWGKPINDGGSPISGYLIEHRRTGSPHWVRATPLLVQFPEITISGLEPGWRYQFRVRAENAVGFSDPSELSDPITVTLQRNAITAPRFIEELKDVVALENEKLEFVVHFVGQPSPTICWFKDGFEIFSSRRIRIQTDNDRSILTIYQCALSDEGEIKCTATNRAGHVSTKAKLTLEAPPTIRLPRQYEDGLLFEIGESIRLKVTIAGRPTPLVFWTHNGESIKNSDRYELESNDRSSILKIDAAERSDRGEYQIKAVNKIGEDVASFLVTITDKPSPPGKAKVIMTLGRSVTLSWSTPPDDGGCKIGSYIIEYYRLGWDVWLKAATSRQLTTILGDLIEGSEYKFRVKAESPYGISEPSEESDVVFIPDPKRGITHPGRAHSQPRDIALETVAPVAAKRKKPRSQSSSRVEVKSKESSIAETISNAGIPVRPERNKIKSPPKTPEASPATKRKEINTSQIKAIFDRDSLARDLAYGSPDFKVKKELNESFITDTISLTPSPTPTSKTSSPISSSPDINNLLKDKNNKSPLSSHSRSPSPSQTKPHSPKENRDHFEGSSEFMLVLYPDENNQGHGVTSEITFDFEDSVPPPMSLSAPELGTEPPPILFGLKTSASSTELLHERAMMRFIKAAEAEEAELEKRRRSIDARKLSVDIPKIQINSQDTNNIVGLERKHSLRRRLSAGAISHQQALWAQRRQSLRNPNEFEGNIPNKLKKFSDILDYKAKDTNVQRQRSTSEEMEEEEFEKVRLKMQKQSSFDKKTIPVVDEEKWDDEYEESLSESESESGSSEFEIDTPNMSNKKLLYENDTDEETYTPGRGANLTKSEEPFEILTVKRTPPDPSFVPKPILKRCDNDESFVQKDMSKVEDDFETKQKKRSHSPMPQNFYTQIRERSNSLFKNMKTDAQKGASSRPRSYSMYPENEIEQKQKELEKAFVESNLNKSKNIFHHISDVAESSVVTAASVVIPEKLIDKKKDIEEAKVVIDHYGDIVRNYSQKNKVKHQTYLDRDKLKEMAEEVELNEDAVLTISKESISTSRNRNDSSSSVGGDLGSASNDLSNSVKQSSSKSSLSEGYKTSSRKSSFSEDYNSKPRKNSLTDSYDSIKSKRSLSPHPKRTPSVSPSRRFNKSKRSASKSPARIENWNNLKSEQKNGKSSSPSRLEIKRKSKSPSPIPLARRKPKLREIMTQTSVGFESFSNESYSRSSTPLERSHRQEELIAQAEVKVRGVIEYLTDLAMFVVACWLYLSQHELLAIPVLFVMVFRQIQSEISRRIPNWIKKRFNRKKRKSN